MTDKKIQYTIIKKIDKMAKKFLDFIPAICIMLCSVRAHWLGEYQASYVGIRPRNKNFLLDIAIFLYDIAIFRV